MYEETDVEGAQLEPLQHPQPVWYPMGSRCAQAAAQTAILQQGCGE